MKQKIGKYFLIIILIFLAIVVRVYFATKYFHIDILSNAGWGQWIAENDAKRFFENNVWIYSWPTQLPLINLIYAWSFDVYRYLIIYLIRFGFLFESTNYQSFLNWFGGPLSTDIPFKIGYLFTIKLLPILSDFAIAWVIWILVKKEKIKNVTWWSLIYLWSPFSIYISAFWGQYDQVAFLLLLLSILSIRKYPILSPLLMSLALGVKPTGAIFIPFYIYLLIKNRQWWKSLVGGIVLAVILNLYLIQLFNPGGSLIGFVWERLVPAVVYKSEQRISVNSYNFWHMMAGDKAVRADANWLFMPFSYWGIMAMFIVNWWAIRLDSKVKNRTFAALAIIGIGSWIFGMNMLERYLFAGVGFSLIATIYEPKLWKIWIPISLMFFVNLYKNWWQPEWLWLIRYFCEDGEMVARFILPISFLVLMFAWIKNYLPRRRSRA